MHRVLNDMNIYVVGAARTPVGVFDGILADEIGRASCRERVEISVVAVSLKKK